MEEIYYKKILITSGEVPENSGLYHTDQGRMRYSTFSKNWQDNELPEYWLKPVPSPEGFAEWVACNFKQAKGANKTWIYKPKDFIGIGAADATIKDYFTISELYDKFKEKGEK